MEDEAGRVLPQVNFGMQELEVIERLLWAYSQYVHRVPAFAQDTQHTQAVEIIRERLAAQLASGVSTDVQLVLTIEDVEVLLHGLLTFVHLIERLFPKNARRDTAIASVMVWRLRLIHILSEFAPNENMQDMGEQ